MTHESKRYCYISQYIEKNDPALFGVLTETCLMPFLRARRGHAGITFIYPTAEVVKKMANMVVEDELEKVNEMILDHIIHYYIDSPEKWQEYADDIPNGHMKKVEVVVARDVVTLEGVKIIPDTKYRQFVPNAGPITQAIWRVEKGGLKHNAAAVASAAPHARAVPGDRTKKGGMSTSVKSKDEFIVTAVNQYIGALASSSNMQIKSHIPEKLCSILCFVKDQHNKIYLELAQYLTPMLISSMVFVFSHLSESVIVAWQKTAQIPIDNAVESYEKMLADAVADCGADKGASIADAALDVTKIDFNKKALARFDQVASARGSLINGVQYFGYMFACYQEAQLIMPEESRILALRAGGMRTQVMSSYYKDVYNLVATVRNPTPFAFSDDAKRMDPDSTATLITIFRNTDLWNWHISHYVKHDSLPAFNTLDFHTTDDEKVISTVYHVLKRNKTVYFEDVKDLSMLIPQLAGLAREKWIQLRDAVEAKVR